MVGSEWDAGTLKNELRNRKLWSTNTHPRFQAEGGQRMTEAQQEARRANAERGRAKRSQQALERAQMVLRALELGATHAQLAERLGIAEASVPSYLCRARERVRQADAT